MASFFDTEFRYDLEFGNFVKLSAIKMQLAQFTTRKSLKMLGNVCVGKVRIKCRLLVAIKVGEQNVTKGMELSYYRPCT